jgi:hypothetical protein
MGIIFITGSSVMKNQSTEKNSTLEWEYSLYVITPTETITRKDITKDIFKGETT